MKPKPLPKDPAEARVAVAKDVIKRLQASKLHIRNGAYVRLIDENSSVPASVVAAEKACRVCALGASLLSFVRLYNNFDIHSSFNDGDIQPGAIERALGGVFGMEQLDLIEAAFEQTGCLTRSLLWSSKEVTLAVEFGRRFKLSPDRLLAIMQNLIDGNGTFDPSIEYEIVEE